MKVRIAAATVASDTAGKEPAFHPPMTLCGDDAQWRLMHHQDSPMSMLANTTTEEEKHIIETLLLRENDGMYSQKKAQVGDTLLRLHCQSPKCTVKAKIVQYTGMLCLYTQNLHKNHLLTVRYILEHSNIPQDKLLCELKARQLHNSSKSDEDNEKSIKKLKEKGKKEAISTEQCSDFASIASLKVALNARMQDMNGFISGSNLNIDGNPLPDDPSHPLHNLIVLKHDVGTGDQGLDDWSQIVFLLPSARAVANLASNLWGMGCVQVEIDYHMGEWTNDNQQIGMSGISDADQVFYPCTVTIQKSEDSASSAENLHTTINVLHGGGAVPITCLKDGATALEAGANACGMIPVNCFAHMMRSPFSQKGSLHGTRGSMCWYYILNVMDPATNKHKYNLKDVFDICLQLVIGKWQGLSSNKRMLIF